MTSLMDCLLVLLSKRDQDVRAAVAVAVAVAAGARPARANGAMPPAAHIAIADLMIRKESSIWRPDTLVKIGRYHPMSGFGEFADRLARR